MKLFLLTQDIIDGYDTYDSCVVAATSFADAQTIHPSSFAKTYHDEEWFGIYSAGELKGTEYPLNDDSWPRRAEQIKVEYLGEAKENIERGLILASYNAG